MALTLAWPCAARPPAPGADLTGVWTNAWYTKLERPKGFKALVATPAEAAAYEAPRRALNGELASKDDALGQNESEFPDNGPGLARIHGQLRSSWITDPADGEIPWKAEARARLRVGKPPSEIYDNVEQRDTDERCLTASGSGVPITNSHDANLLEIVQTPDWLVVVAEKNHEARIAPIVQPHRRAPPSAAPGLWLGDSTARWEGATLVVETYGFRPGITRMSDDLQLSDQARVVERFTRTGKAEITYGFEVSDPSLFTRPWKGEMVFRPAEGRMFEYACHEGNYSLPGILTGWRLQAGAPVRIAKPATR